MEHRGLKIAFNIFSSVLIISMLLFILSNLIAIVVTFAASIVSGAVAGAAITTAVATGGVAAGTVPPAAIISSTISAGTAFVTAASYIVEGILGNILAIVYVAIGGALAFKMRNDPRPEVKTLRKHMIASIILLIVVRLTFIFDALHLLKSAFVIHAIYILYKLNKIE